MTNYLEELQWRGMLHDVMPGAQEHLLESVRSAYALVGGATGMIGDPSGRSTERNLLDEATLRHNQNAIQKQLEQFLDFDSSNENAAVMVNNYDWMKSFSFLDFIRDVGKHITKRKTALCKWEVVISGAI